MFVRLLMVTLLAATALSLEVRSQESLPDPASVESLSPLTEDDLDAAASDAANDIGYAFDDSTWNDSNWAGIPWPRFGMYLKSGPSMQLSDSLFRQDTDLGYEIAFGGREPLFPAYRQVFVDIGGSYMSAFGEGDPLTISGVIDRGTQGIRRLAEFQTLTLNELSRASVHAALGWNYDFSHVPEIARLVTVRFGGRLSFIHGHFVEQPTDALQALIDGLTGGNTFTLANDPLISKTDSAPGAFAGIELASSRPLGRGATAAWLIDGEFAADWLDLRNYVDGTLVTATLMLGISINR